MSIKVFVKNLIKKIHKIVWIIKNCWDILKEILISKEEISLKDYSKNLITTISKLSILMNLKLDLFLECIKKLKVEKN